MRISDSTESSPPSGLSDSLLYQSPDKENVVSSHHKENEDKEERMKRERDKPEDEQVTKVKPKI